MPPTKVYDTSDRDKVTVDTPIAAYDAACEDWGMIDSLLGGTKAMRAAGELYLPAFPKETTPAYDRRLKSTFLFAAYKRTVNAVAGRPFQRSITIGPDVPAAVGDLTEDIDQIGRAHV